MISQLLCDCYGIMKNSEGRTAQVLIKYRKNHDEYWNGANLVDSVKDVYRIIWELHPDCRPLFLFDNSSNHEVRATDCRDDAKLNLFDDGNYQKKTM